VLAGPFTVVADHPPGRKAAGLGLRVIEVGTTISEDELTERVTAMLGLQGRQASINRA